MSTVKKPLTPNLPRQKRRYVVENDEFAGFARRIIRAHGRRVADGDVEALRDLVALSANLDEAIGEAVIGLRAFGYSWTEIGQRLGISKQAAQQRWGGQP
ncbi:hypothetical protein [Micromonospora sp. NPDC050200]|uniref:hypothetical protein n=1 Tax=Micromonospora sp. NPDC050200 TaxID=3155664 RepID=UPI003408F17A